MRIHAIAIAFLIAIAPLTLNAGVINGGFQSGDLSGWTAFTTTNGTLGHVAPLVESFDVTGSGSSLAARFQVGHTTSAGTQAGGGIFQSFFHTGGDLSVSFDIASLATQFDNSSGGVANLLINGMLIDSHDFGSVNFGEVERTSLSGVLNGFAAGSHEFRIQMTRPYTTGPNVGYTPFQYIDNVSAVSSVTGAVPEPGTFAIWSVIAIVGTCCGRRKRRNS